MTLEMCFCLLGCKYFDELIHKEKVPTTIKSMQSMKMEFSSFIILYFPLRVFTLIHALHFVLKYIHTNTSICKTPLCQWSPEIDPEANPLENWSKIDPESRSPTKFGRSPTKFGKFTWSPEIRTQNPRSWQLMHFFRITDTGVSEIFKFSNSLNSQKFEVYNF